MDHLRDDEIRDLIVDRRPQEDDPLVEEARIDVEEALAARRLLDDGRNHEVLRGHAGSLLPGVHSFVSVLGFSLSGVQIASRACACSIGIRFTSVATRSNARAIRMLSRSCSYAPPARSCSITRSGSSKPSRIAASTSSSGTSIPALSATASSTSSPAIERFAYSWSRLTSCSTDVCVI